MAHPDKIPSPHVDRVVEAIREITKQLSGLATNEEELHADNIEPAAIRVNDGLTIWKFKPGSFERLSRDELKDDLFDWVQPTNMVYHPMWLSESPVGFARSTTDLSAKPILQINLSPTSRRAILIHEALARLETSEETESQDPVIASNPVVRLLEIPPAHMVALWLYSESVHQSRIMIISAAKRYAALSERSLLDSNEFLKGLKEQGLIPQVA